MPCMTTALTTGVITAIITALLVAGISVAVHIAVYQCVYKPKLTTRASASANKADDAIVYDVVDERVGTRTVLEMKENEAYGVAQ